MNEKIKKISEIKEKLICCLENELNTRSIHEVDTNEAGQVIDMIKDLAEAEKECCEAIYYDTVVKAMESYENEENGDERMGYNTNRLSNGRFTTSGRGRRGFHPMISQYPEHELRDPEIHERMGYTGNVDYRYGKAYNDYDAAKKYYTKSNSPEHKTEMNRHAMEHVNDTVISIQEMWKDADPELRKRIKEHLTKLIADMS